MRYIYFTFIYFILTLYPIYKNYTYGYGHYQYARHLQFITNESSFYNAWQNRGLCPLLIEGIYRTTKSFFSDVSSIKLYNTLFILLRIIEGLIILILTRKLTFFFSKSEAIAFLLVLISSYSMANSFRESDLSFNTFADVIFYQLALYFLLNNKPNWYFIPLVFFASFNRETSALIPILWLGFKTFSEQEKLSVKNLSYFAFLIVMFAIPFVGQRVYNGIGPEQVGFPTIGIEMFNHNFLSSNFLMTIFEELGTFSVLPLIIFYFYNKLDMRLKVTFILIVPAWFIVHYFASVAKESRLFLVPTLVIFLPCIANLCVQPLLAEKN